MISEELKANTLDHINEMLEKIRSLSLLVETGMKIADKDEDLVSHFRLYNAKCFLGLAQVDLSTAPHWLDKGSERVVEELITMATEHLSLAKLSYAYNMEYRNNPERSVEEIFEAAADAAESLYI